MFTITIQGENAAAAIAELQRAAEFYTSGRGAPIAAAAAEEAAPAPAPSAKATRANKPAAAKTTEAPAPAPTPAAAPAPTETPAADAATVTIEEVRAYLVPLLRDVDKAPAVSKLIASFGVSKLSEVPADKLAALFAQAKTEFPQ